MLWLGLPETIYILSVHEASWVCVIDDDVLLAMIEETFQREGVVASLSMVSSSGTALGNSELEQRKLLLQSIKKKQYKGMTQARINFMLHQNNADDTELSSTIKAMSDDLGPATLATQTEATSERKNVLDALANLQIPVHFILGEHDKIASPKQCLSHASLSRQIQTTVIEGAGHMLPLEKSKQLALALSKTFKG